jgi:hypothetical protein
MQFSGFVHNLLPPSATAAAATTTTTAEATTAAAAATTAAAAEATTTAAAAAEAATTAATILTRTRFVDDDRATIHLIAIELRNSRLDPFACFHFDETETAGAAGVAISDDVCRFYRAGLAEQLVQILIGDREGKIPYIQFH